MTSESLSQDEIDLLFKGGGDSDGTDAPAERRVSTFGTDVQVYDFRRPARISKDRKRSLMAIYGVLTKSVERWVTSRVRDAITMELQSVEQLTFGEFILALPSPCASFTVKVGGAGGHHHGVIDFGHEFAYFVVDRMLGGSGTIHVPERTLTPMERMVTRLVADRVVSLLADAWEDYVHLDLDVEGFESIPEMLQVANREDTVLVANILVSMGNTSSLLLLCLPFAVLDRFFTVNTIRRQDGADRPQEELQLDQRRIEGTLRYARITVGARLPEFQVPLKELADMVPGTILKTGISPDSDLEVFVAGQKRFSASPGRVGNRLSVRILDNVKSEPPDLIQPGRERTMIP